MRIVTKSTLKNVTGFIWVTLFERHVILFSFYLDSDGLEVLRDVDENGDDEDGNGELEPSPAHRLRRDGRAVLVRVADGHVPLVGDRDDNED